MSAQKMKRAYLTGQAVKCCEIRESVRGCAYMNQRLSASEFAKRAGVSVKTLQRWDREGRLKPAGRTPTNRRYYTEDQLTFRGDDDGRGDLETRREP